MDCFLLRIWHVARKYFSRLLLFFNTLSSGRTEDLLLQSRFLKFSPYQTPDDNKVECQRFTVWWIRIWLSINVNQAQSRCLSRQTRMFGVRKERTWFKKHLQSAIFSLVLVFFWRVACLFSSFRCLTKRVLLSSMTCCDLLPQLEFTSNPLMMNKIQRMLWSVTEPRASLLGAIWAWAGIRTLLRRQAGLGYHEDWW